MGQESEEKRMARMLDQGRTWAERAATDVGETLGRAWREVAGSAREQEGSDERAAGGRSGLDDLAKGEPGDLFDRERQEELAKMGKANILIIGQTGVGKSTLINAVFRKPLAVASTGRPVTKVIERFEDPDVPVTLYDSAGVELGQSKDRLIKDFKKTIAKSRKAQPEDHIHLLWYCMDAGQTRVQDYDIEIIRALAEDVPVVLVFTQTIDDERADELEKTVLEEGLPIEGDRAIRTLATARRIQGRTLKPLGLDELVRTSTDALPEAVKRAFINAQGIVLDLKTDQGRLIVATASAAAAGAAAAPLPASDAFILRPIQLGMLGGVTAVFGVDISIAQAGELVKSVFAQQRVEKVGKKLVKEIGKHVPGGNVLNATIAAAVTAALGEAYVRLCVEMLKRQASGKAMPSGDMQMLFIDTYRSLLPGTGGSKKAKVLAEPAEPHLSRRRGPSDVRQPSRPRGPSRERKLSRRLAPSQPRGARNSKESGEYGDSVDTADEGANLRLVARIDEQYVKVSDFAERFGFERSTVLKKIKRGEIRAVQIGKSWRIPSDELMRYLYPTETLDAEGAPEDGQPANPADRAARFEEATGKSPREYVEAWRKGEIPDTPESASLAIEALALRAALEQGTPAPA